MNLRFDQKAEWIEAAICSVLRAAPVRITRQGSGPSVVQYTTHYTRHTHKKMTVTMKEEWLNPTSTTGGTRVFVVRHGQTDWNIAGILQGHTDISLNDTGVEQARALGRRLAAAGFTPENFDVVVSSDLKRCRQTLEALFDGLGASSVPDHAEYTPELRERCMGDVEGMHIAAAREKFGPLFKERGEPQKEMQRRVAGRVADATARAQEMRSPQDSNPRTVLVCTHGGAVRALVAQWTAQGWRMPANATDSPANTCLSLVEMHDHNSDGTEKTPALAVYGCTAHLDHVDKQDTDLR